MIRYSLHCPDDHHFDSWFQSADAYEVLATGGHLSCPVCGSARIGKALMAPAVVAPRSAQAAALQAATDPRVTALETLRREIETNSEYVGGNFAAEARAMHEGEAPERSIYGEARLEEARKLLEDGVPVAPLPFLPLRKMN